MSFTVLVTKSLNKWVQDMVDGAAVGLYMDRTKYLDHSPLTSFISTRSSVKQIFKPATPPNARYALGPSVPGGAL